MENAMEIRKCFSYNGDGLRCMAVAGHDGPHSHAIEWTDEEAWTPETVTLTLKTAAPLIPAAESPVASGRCVICEHIMHASVCGAPDGDGFTCDCSTGVE